MDKISRAGTVQMQSPHHHSPMRKYGVDPGLPYRLSEDNDALLQPGHVNLLVGSWRSRFGLQEMSVFSSSINGLTFINFLSSDWTDKMLTTALHVTCGNEWSIGPCLAHLAYSHEVIVGAIDASGSAMANTWDDNIGSVRRPHLVDAMTGVLVSHRACSVWGTTRVHLLVTSSDATVQTFIRTTQDAFLIIARLPDSIGVKQALCGYMTEVHRTVDVHVDEMSWEGWSSRPLPSRTFGSCGDLVCVQYSSGRRTFGSSKVGGFANAMESNPSPIPAVLL
ncbi:uncharacterized protein BCR38DRAFT_475348 [Pseudomassariella vexata]|uniref:Uncharacterized protein n=1 Tax=Pseudomassariella vexata TaxID=1141098 RepID=A0A1Y2DW81_9PEZI|nr:uncharacterized protein BCR38DRAFT_475348 [Pseudomassariella vexata]ORY63396.1 hypothetical protein BCR38DRAFT_475348 [Pseudomassariella vexata]